MNGLPRVGFLFNHDQIHQVAHSLPVALALARTGGAQVVLAATSDALEAEVRRLGGAQAGEVVRLRLTSPVSRVAAGLLDAFVPARKYLMYGDNLPFFRALDALVVAEKTALTLRRHPGLERLRMVHTRHGAGDRAVGYDRASARFDRVLVSGPKVAERLVREAGVDPARLATVGYPKFDVAPAAPAPRLFENDRPTVLYNPHGSPHLSSWYRMGRRVLEGLARSDRYNLVFAPHVMLFRRPVVVSVDRPGIAFPGRVPAVAQAAKNVRIDLGSAASTDMTYTEAADIYLGDVSSQVYEFLRRPRPCVFLDAHGNGGLRDGDFLHWRAGPVVDDVDQLEAALERAQAEHDSVHAPVQRELFARTFDLTATPSSERAAAAVLDLLAQGGAPPPVAEGPVPSGSAGVVRRIYANLALLLSGKAAAGVISLGYLAIAARTLGPKSYGALVLVHAYAITVGGIVNFPGWHAVVRFGAQAAAADDRPRMLRLLRLTAVVELSAGAVAVVVAAALAPLLGPHLGWPPVALAFATPYSLAVLASVRSTPAGYLQLKRRFDLLGLHNAVAPGVRLVGAGAAAWAGWGLPGFLAVWLAAALCEWAALWIMGLWVARRDLAAHRLVGGLRGVVNENPGLWRFMIAANSDVTFSELAGRLAPLTVGWVLGPASAGLYAVAQRASVVIAQPAQVLGQAAYAELARLAAEHGGVERLRGALLRCVGVALLTAAPVTALLLVFAPEVARLLAGKAFVGAAGTIVWLALARTILLAGPPSSAALVAMGRPGLSVTANLLSSLGLLPVLILLMRSFGLPGAGVHAVAQAAAAVGLLAVFVVREIGRPAPAASPA